MGPERDWMRRAWDRRRRRGPSLWTCVSEPTELAKPGREQTARQVRGTDRPCQAESLLRYPPKGVEKQLGASAGV